MTHSEHRRRRHKGDHGQPSRRRGQPNEPSTSRVPPAPPQRELFPQHWHSAAVRTRAQSGHCFVGLLRINSKSVGGEGYVTIPDVGVDVMVRKVDLNRAMAGDTVAIRIVQPRRWWTFGNVRQRDQPAEMPELLSEDNIQDGPALRMLGLRNQILQEFTKRKQISGNEKKELDVHVEWDLATSPEETKSYMKEIVRHFPERRPTGFVVSIVEPSNKRQSLVGMIQSDHETSILYFCPLDAALPKIFMVAMRPCELDWKQLVEEAKNRATQRTMVEATFVKWDVHGIVGSTGSIESETKAILVKNGIRDCPFSEDLIRSLPEASWTPSEDDLKHRWDFRDVCVFSIDPRTARDLDDALSIEQLEEDKFRVGVHIADVSLFVKPSTPLDKEAQKRTSSVYLVQRVIPMLPEVLSSWLCSLKPGEDRLTFSVVWEMNKKGEISKQEIQKSIIRSCCQLAYEHAQTVIEDPNADIPENVTFYGEHSWNHVRWGISALFEISQHLKARREDNGTLSLNLPKIGFILGENGFPEQARTTIQKESNRLIQEFMLLANMSVAKFLSETYPNHALLRCHPPPSGRPLTELTEIAEELQIDLDVTSAASLQQGLYEIYSRCKDGHSMDVVTNIATKPMQLAQYFCTGAYDREHWRHYALAVDQYTHFTSPIRRYPDIIVHRWLEMAINERDGFNLHEGDTKSIQSLAEMCNRRKLSSRMAQDASLDLFLMMWLEKNPVETVALVSSVKGNRFIDVYVPRFSIGTRILCEEFPKHVKAIFDRQISTLILIDADLFLRNGKQEPNGQEGQHKHRSNGRKTRNHETEHGQSTTREETRENGASISVRAFLEVIAERVTLHLTPIEARHEVETVRLIEKATPNEDTQTKFAEVSLEVTNGKVALVLNPKEDTEVRHETEHDVRDTPSTVSLQFTTFNDQVQIELWVLVDDTETTATSFSMPRSSRSLTGPSSHIAVESKDSDCMTEDAVLPLKLPSRLKRFSRIPVRVTVNRCPLFGRLMEIKVNVLFEAA